MKISRLGLADLNTAVEIMQAFYTRQPSEQAMREYLANEANYLIVCKQNEQVVGFAYGYELQRFDGQGRMMYLHQIEVLPEYRKQGIGRQLISEFIHICKHRNFLRLFMITNKSNKPSVALYSSAGGEAPCDDDVVFAFRISE